MVDLNISYEDGLRLSELVGQLDGQQFQLEHFVQMATPSSVVIGCLVAALIVFILMAIWCNWCEYHLEKLVKVKYQDVVADLYNPATCEWERHRTPGPKHCMTLSK